jgi:hypothetical protein
MCNYFKIKKTVNKLHVRCLNKKAHFLGQISDFGNSLPVPIVNKNELLKSTIGNKNLIMFAKRICCIIRQAELKFVAGKNIALVSLS